MGGGYTKVYYKLNIYKSKEEYFLEFKIKNSEPQNEDKFNILYTDDKNRKKYNLNIIYYDENLISGENSDNCTFFQMNITGTFYGCHYFKLFKIILEKIIKNNKKKNKEEKKEFILITSGSSAEKIFEYCSDVEELREYYIYCFYPSKYTTLLKKYSPKLKGIYDNFDELKKKLFEISEMKIDNISSSNMIFFEDYNRLYIRLHYEFIRKYSLYKLLKSNKCDEKEFLALVKKQFPYFLDLAKQLFPNKNEVIEMFKKELLKNHDST